MHPKLAALAVVVRDNAVLLVKRKKEPDAGKWGFPGGHVDLGESAMAAAVRELREETGVIATPVRYLTNLDIIISDDAGGFAFHFLLAAVQCQYQSGTPIAADDVSDARWFDLTELPQIDTSADVAKVTGLVHDPDNRPKLKPNV